MDRYGESCFKFLEDPNLRKLLSDAARSRVSSSVSEGFFLSDGFVLDQGNAGECDEAVSLTIAILQAATETYDAAWI